MQLFKRAPMRLLCVGTLLAAPLVTVAQEDAPAEETAASSIPKDQVMRAMGYAMAQQFLRLNLGFTEEEIDYYVEGLRAFTFDQEEPENYKVAVQEAQRYYFEKMQAKRAVEDAERAEKAKQNRADAEEFLASIDAVEGVQSTDSGLRYEILVEGDGEKPVVGNAVKVNYTGTRVDGTEFDSGEGADFVLRSVGGLVDGFKEGLQLIGEGGTIKLYIPPDLGYGDNPRPGGSIEPGDALIFEVELLEVKEGPPAPPKPTSRPTGVPAGGPPSGRPPGAPPGPPPNVTPPAPPSSLPPNIPPPPSED